MFGQLLLSLVERGSQNNVLGEMRKKLSDLTMQSNHAILSSFMQLNDGKMINET